MLFTFETCYLDERCVFLQDRSIAIHHFVTQNLVELLLFPLKKFVCLPYCYWFYKIKRVWNWGSLLWHDMHVYYYFEPTDAYNFIKITITLQDTSSYIIRATCGWKACDVCPEAVPTLCSKSRISQCNWVCVKARYETRKHVHSRVSIKRKKK